MAIIGNIIKGVINLRDVITPEANPVEAQEKVLKKLLKTAKNTAFGKYYSFESILENDHPSKAFAENIPYHDYDKMYQNWWKKLLDGEKDITWPGKPNYFALSSGTTGKTSKRIPVTDAMVEAIQQAGIKQVFALSNFDLPADFFEKEIMMLGSSTDLEKNKDHLEGEISGISASKIPDWFRGYYKPGEKIAKIDDWDERVKHIAENAKNWDIGALSGIPSWLELMLAEVIKYHNVKTIHDIWPNLQVYTSGGVAFGPYEKSFNALLEKPITIIDTYLASEGFIAYQERPETHAMKLIVDNGIYFEFVPFNPDYINQDGSIKDSAPCLTLAEVELDQDYVLIISTVSGAWRYLIGDTIAFTDLERAEIVITGRTKFFLNTVGSQLSVNKMDDAVQYLEEQLDVKIPEYTLAAKRFDDDFYHSWYLGSDLEHVDSEKIADLLDNFLADANKNYKVARSKALKGVKVNVVKSSIFHEWSGANKKKGGQVKMERVMNEEKFKEWEDFVKETQPA
ncbi:GH3 auxin-responsive promoter family protein [Tamlana haliotis]|uniref:GH3 auxin-responsive promoter family protein n=1 Tax=Pseudotamlana haliotis TaxID=2614804 RepID=A0A6N6MB26_9FLAO|nr:GH3 auxin-responsive promoter family protein [Tamlana haliotis]KAB1067762.1 GH3 auxin-responsive promoter family protein [Tamlana haliotis]